jgi:hypothetical protein
VHNWLKKACAVVDIKCVSILGWNILGYNGKLGYGG